MCVCATSPILIHAVNYNNIGIYILVCEQLTGSSARSTILTIMDRYLSHDSSRDYANCMQTLYIVHSTYLTVFHNNKYRGGNTTVT